MSVYYSTRQKERVGWTRVKLIKEVCCMFRYISTGFPKYHAAILASQCTATAHISLQVQADTEQYSTEKHFCTQHSEAMAVALNSCADLICTDFCDVELHRKTY